VKSSGTQTFRAYVGIDWADTKHDFCLQERGSDRREFGCIAHQVECIDEWAKSLQQRFGTPVAIALELAKGPIVYALQKYDFLVLFPINPLTLAKYREAFKPSRAKDDPSDAELALDLLIRHPERFAALRPQSVGMRTLISLTERRRELVNDKIRLTNRLTHTLKEYYPQALDWLTRHRSVLRLPDPLADAASGQARSPGQPQGVLPCPQRTPSADHCRALESHQSRSAAHTRPRRHRSLQIACHGADRAITTRLTSY
jgi:transposase